MLRKSVAHRLLNFVVNTNGKPPRIGKSDMRFRFTREGFAVAVKKNNNDN